MKVIFIVKPLRSHKLSQLRKTLNATFSDKNDSHQIFLSMKRRHAITLTQKAIEEKADVIVACGGDGTINEVARTMLGSGVTLGIIPLGSGNGIARHFRIPFDIPKAVELIKQNNTTPMDVGEVNGNLFLGNMGCALESYFIKYYQKNEWHGLLAYFVAFLDAIVNFKHHEIQIEVDDKIKKISPFVFLASNTNQQGYDFSLTPEAQSDDGQLDLFWMEKTGWINKIKFLIATIFKQKLQSPEFNRMRFSNLKITPLDSHDFCVQVDGEYLPTTDKKLEIKVLPKKLNVIVAQKT
ncbi:MAG: diacylglycerol kinase family protein [Flavobacteriaceae bacterium]